MALLLAFDPSEVDNPISSETWENPDLVTGNATDGLIDGPTDLYMFSDDGQFEYKEVVIEAEGDEAGILIRYALPEPGGDAPDESTFVTSLTLPDGTYDEADPVKFYRIIEVPNQSEPINVQSIKHKITAEVYLQD